MLFSPTFTANSGPKSAGKGWCAGWQNGGHSSLLQRTPCSLLFNHTLVLRASYFIPTAPHQVSILTTISILWIRKSGFRRLSILYNVPKPDCNVDIMVFLIARLCRNMKSSPKIPSTIEIFGKDDRHRYHMASWGNGGAENSVTY